MSSEDHTEPDLAALVALRDQLLGPLRNQVLTTDQLCEAGRLICGRPEGLSLYGIPAPEMEAKGIWLLGRTTIECSKDPHPATVANVVAELQAALPTTDGDAMIVDLFCGSGNFGHHLGQRLGHPVYASELDPVVYEATRNNLDRIGSTIELHLIGYRDLLGRLPARGDRDTYVIEPPWGLSLTPDGLDLTLTSPPVPEILNDIRRSRRGVPCLVVIETNDRIARDSLNVSFRDAMHLRTITPEPTLPYGANPSFHIYRLGASVRRSVPFG